MSNSPVAPMPTNIVEVDKGLVCLQVNPQNGSCITWAVMKKSEPLLPEMTKQQANEITVAILLLMVIAWSFSMLKKAF